MVQRKKRYGQHFLTNKVIGESIVSALRLWGERYDTLIEVGPGDGFLTGILSDRLTDNKRLIAVEIDEDLIDSLQARFSRPNLEVRLLDFLSLQLNEMAPKLGVIGNFPYNISSQILFKVYDHIEQVDELLGMFQKEVADRVVAKHGSKQYGILSVLMQAHYQIETVMTLKPGAFSPPPKVQSSVIHLLKHDKIAVEDRVRLKSLVKQAFSQRRKTLQNALKAWGLSSDQLEILSPWLSLRAEQIPVEDYVLMASRLTES